MVIRRSFSANIFSKIESLAILLARLMTQCWHGRSFINVKKVCAVVNMRWIGEAASSEVRQAYKQLIGAVVQFMDQETPSEEFHEVVLTLYRLFSSQMAEDDIDRIISDKKLELTKLLGHTVADANLRLVASLAQTLLKVQPSNNVERNLDASEDLEFGADFNFVAPARFLIDVTLDIEDMMDYKGTATLAVQEGHYGHIGPTDHSVVDGAKFNLSWLTDACDKIVRNSLLHLSRDELAMTICRGA